jgi:hypothetical protein
MPEDLMGELSELIGDVRTNVDERLRYLVEDDGEWGCPGLTDRLVRRLR